MKLAKGLRNLPPGVLWFMLAVAGLIFAIFWEPLFSGLFIWGPDSGSGAFDPLRATGFRMYLGRWEMGGLGTASAVFPLVPYHPVYFLAPAATVQAWVYIATVVGSVLAGLYLFHGRGIRGWPAYLGALALGFTPHTFSVISAGHMGKLEAMPFLILLLAAEDRAIRRQSWFHFALAGYAAGVALAMQADVAMLFVFLAIAYGFFLLVRMWPRASGLSVDNADAGQSLLRLRIRYLRRNMLGTLFAGILVCCVSFGPAYYLLTKALPERQNLAQAVGSQQDTKGKDWEFATNWSLPPEEILEFFAAGIFGWQTGDPNVPYWGRTGRTLGWDEHHRGLMSLRQNAHYLGLLQWVFALYAIAWAVRARGQRSEDSDQRTAIRGQKSEAGSQRSEVRGQQSESRSQPSILGTQSASQKPGVRSQPSIFHSPFTIHHSSDSLRSRRSDILFWASVLLVSVLLALGRNFVLYRVFYCVLPYGSSMRAPVKFLHLAEVALCILLAFGLDRLFSELAAVRNVGTGEKKAMDRSSKGMKSHQRMDLTTALAPLGILRSWTRFAIGCGVIGLAMLLAAALIPAHEQSLLQIWRMQGMADNAGALLDGMTWAVTRGGLLFLGVAAVFLSVRLFPKSRAAAGLVPIALMGLLALDLGSVDKHYVRVWDEYTRYTPSQMIDRLQQDKAASYRVALPVAGGIYELWKTRLFPRHDIAMMDASAPGTMYAENQPFYALFSRYPLRFWQLTSTRDIMGPKASLAPLTNSPAVEVAAFFNVMSDGSVQWVGARDGQQVWLRLKNVLPRAALYPAWEVVQGDAWEQRLDDPRWDPTRTVIVSDGVAASGGAGGTCAPAEIVDYKSNRVRLKTQSETGGILLLNDQFDPDWKAFIDGKSARLLRCNGVMRGVQVPEGTHDIVLTYEPDLAVFALSLVSMVTIVVWGGIRLARAAWRRRRVPAIA